VVIANEDEFSCLANFLVIELSQMHWEWDAVIE